jgi:hypothetical protein
MYVLVDEHTASARSVELAVRDAPSLESENVGGHEAAVVGASVVEDGVGRLSRVLYGMD